MSKRRVTIVGGGVIGLTTAHELAVAGHDVTIIADADTARTVSATAAAIWFPYRSERSAAIDEQLRHSLATFTALAAEPEAGVDLRYGRVLERTSDLERTWTALVPSAMEAQNLPDGVLSGVSATLPVITMPLYLPWLRARAERHGVRIQRGEVRSLADLADAADVVIVATGIRGGELLGGDESIHPIRGQIVRLGGHLDEWVIDDDNPAGQTYVIPRRDEVIVGGTAVDGSWDTATHPDVEEAILDRATALVPALRDLPIVGRAAGLRPARPTIRVERVDGYPMEVIAAYGHGGAGVTLSWGTARAVTALM